MSLWVGCSKTWRNTSYLYPIFTMCNKVKAHAKIFDRSIFCISFYFCMQNVHAKYAKISTIRKFPTIWYMQWAASLLFVSSRSSSSFWLPFMESFLDRDSMYIHRNSAHLWQPLCYLLVYVAHTIKWQIYVWGLFCTLCESSSGCINLTAPYYVTMHKTLEHINKIYSEARFDEFA